MLPISRLLALLTASVPVIVPHSLLRASISDSIPLTSPLETAVLPPPVVFFASFSFFVFSNKAFLCSSFIWLISPPTSSGEGKFAGLGSSPPPSILINQSGAFKNFNVDIPQSPIFPAAFLIAPNIPFHIPEYISQSSPANLPQVNSSGFLSGSAPLGTIQSAIIPAPIPLNQPPTIP